MVALPKVPVSSMVDWPRDEAAHPGLPWELWYLTATVRAGERTLAPHVVLLHFGSGHVHTLVSLADLDRGIVTEASSTVGADAATLAQDHLETTGGAGGISGSFEEGYRVTGRLENGDGFDLHLRPTVPVLLAHGVGRFLMRERATTQYSLGGLATTGTVRLEGEAGYDRQWVDGDGGGEVGAFTWFGLHLDNGDTLSLFDTTVGGPGGRTWATIVRPDGTHLVVAAEPLATSARGSFITPRGHDVPEAWTLRLPGVGAELEVVQRMVDDPAGTFFYTGAVDLSGTYDGVAVSGAGFCDLVGWEPPPAS